MTLGDEIHAKGFDECGFTHSWGSRESDPKTFPKPNGIILILLIRFRRSLLCRGLRCVGWVNVGISGLFVKRRSRIGEGSLLLRSQSRFPLQDLWEQFLSLNTMPRIRRFDYIPSVSLLCCLLRITTPIRQRQSCVLLVFLPQTNVFRLFAVFVRFNVCLCI